MDWIVDKVCATTHNVDLVIERVKRGWQCSDTTKGWHWNVIRGGGVVEEGVEPTLEAAKEEAVHSVK